jgi:predicted DNA-binding transcriptional regulator AlpA
MTDCLVDIDELSRALGGLSRASIYRHIKNLPNFPQPVKVGASTRFRESDIQAFVASTSTPMDKGAMNHVDH